jgi:D-glycero-D-manno-heptose 1,7-bisphosphate phosphatase
LAVPDHLTHSAHVPAPAAARLVFLDRDGTLIRHLPYLCDPALVELLPTVPEGLRLLREADCRLFLHTNQSGIGRGYFSRAQAEHCNAAMLRQIGLGDDLFEDTCICPETPDQPQQYRKPSPRYGLEILRRHAIEPRRAVYIGDNTSDLLTARNVGCQGVGVNTGMHDLRGLLREHGLAGAFEVFDSFIDAARHVIAEMRT